MSEIKGLSNDFIAELLAGSRGRDVYKPKLVDFLASDEAAVDVKATWPEFAGKKGTTLYQGFIGALKGLNADGTERAADANGAPNLGTVVMCKQRDGQVYLMHKERAILAAAEAANAAS